MIYGDEVNSQKHLISWSKENTLFRTLKYFYKIFADGRKSTIEGYTLTHTHTRNMYHC